MTSAPNAEPRALAAGRNPDERNIVAVRGLRKQYGDFHAVKGIDFDIAAGRCFGFLGPNGAGKTTTLRMLLGMTPYTSGEVRIFGRRMPEQGAEIRRITGVVPQGDNLDPDFTVAENLFVFAKYFGYRHRDIAPRIQQLLEFVALQEKAGEKTDKLSGGMKRRLTIARALINSPQLVLLDEPTTGLDPQARHVIWSKLLELRNQGATLILTTHYMEEAERLCDELVIMDHGLILDQGTPRALIGRHVEPDVIEIRNAEAALAARVVALPGVRSEALGSTLYCYTRTPAVIHDLLKHYPQAVYLHRPAGLEDVFLKLTGRELRD
jgi:lipooligosaccharide transport system ATP-binding protein